MTQKQKIIFFILVALLIWILPQDIFAQQTKGAYLPNPLGITDIPTLIGRIIKTALGIVGSIALLMFIWGGFLWLTSAGNEQKITKGRNVLTWAAIGLVIIFLSYTMVNFVIGTLTGKVKPPAGQEPSQALGCCYTCAPAVAGTAVWIPGGQTTEDACPTPKAWVQNDPNCIFSKGQSC